MANTGYGSRSAEQSAPASASARAEVHPDRHLTYLIAKVEHRLTLELDRALRPAGLTLVQFSALANIHARPGISSADLARALLISPQAVGTLIQRMLAAGLIRSEQRPRGHSGALTLTALGEERLHVAEGLAITSERRSLAALTAGEQATVFEHLTRLLTAPEPSERDASTGD